LYLLISRKIQKKQNVEVFGGLGLMVERDRHDLALTQRGF